VSRPVAGFISFRLGGGDGVSVEAAKWQAAFGILGFDVLTVAGEGSADRLIPALGIRASEPPSAAEVTDALAPADLVVVENLMSLPLNPGASAVVASVLRDRATLVRHHDLPWQREQFENHPPPPDSPRWRHVVINQISRRQLAAHRIESTVMRNTFDVDQPPGDRKRGRAEIDVDESELLVLQPTRAIPRKNVAGGLALTAELGGVFWLLGPPEDGFGPEVEALVSTARCRVIRGNAPGSDSRAMTDVYAASDVVALPSTWRSNRPFTAGHLRSGATRSQRSSQRSGFGGSTQLIPARSAPGSSTREAVSWSATTPSRVLTSLPERSQIAWAGCSIRQVGYSLDVSVDRLSGPSVRADDATPAAATSKRLPADQRREQLLEVALRLFATSGFNATTMDDIAEEAGVTKPLLYQHFDSKRALYLELVDSVAKSLLEGIGKAVAEAEGPRQQVEGGFAAYFNLVVTHADAFRLLFGSDVPNDPELSRAVRRVENMIAEAIDVLIDADLEEDHRRMLGYAVVGMAEGASRHFLESRTSAGQEDSAADAAQSAKLASRLADLAWAGLRTVHRD
jgi:AcrR family transcriptional regulator